ncbi:unnamed protein product, partial [Ixodes pacificus]
NVDGREPLHRSFARYGQSEREFPLTRETLCIVASVIGPSHGILRRHGNETRLLKRALPSAGTGGARTGRWWRRCGAAASWSPSAATCAPSCSAAPTYSARAATATRAAPRTAPASPRPATLTSLCASVTGGTWPCGSPSSPTKRRHPPH